VNGFIYIIQSGDDDLYKVGLTQDSPEKRKKELDKTGTPKKLKLIESYEVENIYQIEKEIHNNLKEFNTQKEWFAVSLSVLKPIVEETVKNFKINTPEEEEHSSREDINDLIELEENIKFEDISIKAIRYEWGEPLFFTLSKIFTGKTEGQYGVFPDIIFKNEGPGRLWERSFYIFTYNNYPKRKKLEKIKFNIKENKDNPKLSEFINKFLKQLRNLDTIVFLNNTKFPENLSHLQYALSYIEFSNNDFNQLWKKWNDDLFKRTKGKLPICKNGEEFFQKLYKFISSKRDNKV